MRTSRLRPVARRGGAHPVQHLLRTSPQLPLVRHTLTHNPAPHKVLRVAAPLPIFALVPIAFTRGWLGVIT